MADYLIEQEIKSMEVLPFDGWHVDQLGNRGTRYDKYAITSILSMDLCPS